MNMQNKKYMSRCMLNANKVGFMCNSMCHLICLSRDMHTTFASYFLRYPLNFFHDNVTIYLWCCISFNQPNGIYIITFYLVNTQSILVVCIIHWIAKHSINVELPSSATSFFRARDTIPCWSRTTKSSQAIPSFITSTSQLALSCPFLGHIHFTTFSTCLLVFLFPLTTCNIVTPSSMGSLDYQMDIPLLFLENNCILLFHISLAIYANSCTNSLDCCCMFNHKKFLKDKFLHSATSIRSVLAYQDIWLDYNRDLKEIKNELN